jgi:hypothetical protein
MSGFRLASIFRSPGHRAMTIMLVVDNETVRSPRSKGLLFIHFTHKVSETIGGLV